MMAILEEFSSRKATAVGLTLDFHYNCRRVLEREGLRTLFEMALTLLQRLKPPLEPQDQPIFTHAVAAVEMILEWEFTNDTAAWHRLRCSTQWNLPVAHQRFPKHWQPLILNADFLQLFFNLFLGPQPMADLRPKFGHCLLQLAGLHASNFPSSESKQSYAALFLANLHRSLSSPVAQDPEIRYLLCQITHKLIGTFRLNILARLASFPEFLRSLVDLTVATLQRAPSAAEYADDVDDLDESWDMEAFDELLQAWASILYQLEDIFDQLGTHHPHSHPHNHQAVAELGFDPQSYAEMLVQAGYHIFETYTHTRMQAASSEDDDIMEDFKDQEIYDDQLIAVTGLARCCGWAPVRFLAELLKQRVAQFKAVLEGSSRISETELSVLFDHVHWLMIIGGYLISDAGTGETPCIPKEWLRPHDRPSPSESNPIVELVSAVLGLVDVMTSVQGTAKTEFLSPLVCDTAFWFLARWSQTYFFTEVEVPGGHESCVGDYVEAYGCQKRVESVAANRLLDFLVQKTQVMLMMMSGETEVVFSAIHLLETFSKNDQVRTRLLVTAMDPNSTWEKFVLFVVQHLSAWPGETHSTLISALVRVSAGRGGQGQVEELRLKYLHHIFELVETRFMQLIQRPNFQQTMQNTDVMTAVQDILETFTGLVSALDYSSAQTQPVIFRFCAKFFGHFLTLMGLYRVVPEISIYVLEFWMKLLRYLRFDRLTGQERQLTFDSVLALLKSFAASRQGQRANQKAVAADQILYDDLLIILKMLSNLMASDFIEHDLLPGQTVTHLEVVLMCLQVVIPLIDSEAMAVPKVCMEYMQLISTIMEFHAEKVAMLPPNLFTSLMKSVEFGLEHTLSSVCKMAFEAVDSLAEQYRLDVSSTDQDPNRPVRLEMLAGALDHLLQSILSLLLFKDYDMDLVDSVASSTLLHLLKARQDSFQRLMEPVLNQALTRTEGPAATNPDMKPRILQAFNQFSTDLQGLYGANSGGKPRGVTDMFKKHLMRWLMEVRGLVCIR